MIISSTSSEDTSTVSLKYMSIVPSFMSKSKLMTIGLRLSSVWFVTGRALPVLTPITKFPNMSSSAVSSKEM